MPLANEPDDLSDLPDPGDFVSNWQRSAQAEGVNSLDDDPEKAARAQQLAEATGDHPALIYSDLENYEKQHKATLTAQLLNNNQYLTDYVNSHPLAAKISNDDYGQLDATSQAVQKIGQKGFIENLATVLKGAWHGISGEEPEQYKAIGDSTKDYLLKLGVPEADAQREADLIAGRAYRSEELQQILFAIPMTIAAPGIAAFQTYVSQPLEKATGFPAQATEGLTMALLAALGLKGEAGRAKLQQTAAAVEPYIKSGQAPPVGLDPVTDQLHVEQAKSDVEVLSEATKEAQKSATRERSQELFAAFARQHVGDKEIGVSADAIRELYGDRVPSSDDNLLGWVPGLAEQLSRAEATGGDVQIPLADWLARVEPEVEKALRDHIRVREGGMTVEEGKLKSEPQEASGDLATDLRNANRLQPQQLSLPAEGTTRMEDRPAFGKGAVMPIRDYALYQRLIDKRNAEDVEFLTKRAEAEQRKTQTAEWKANRAALRPEVVEQIKARPEHELDEMLREGRVKLDLPQDSGLPKEWLSKEGIHPDDLAGLFGEQTADGVVQKLRDLHEAREASGMRPGDFLRRLVDVETDRQMEAKYGDLQKNILDEVKDQVLSETQEQLLHEETMSLAEQAGAEFSITKEQLKAWVKGRFDETPIKALSSDKLLAEGGRTGRAVEQALLKEDPAEAFRQKQRQYIAVSMAREAKKLEKIRDQFDRRTKRFSKREVPSIEQNYTNFIRDILLKVGELDPRQGLDLQATIAKAEGGYKNLADFVEKKNADGLVDGTAMPVPDFLLDDNFQTKLDNLTAAQFKAVNDTLSMIQKQGRDVNKVLVGAEKQELRDWVAAASEKIKAKFPEVIKYPGTRTAGAKIKDRLKSYIAAIKNNETLFNRLDNRDPRGIFNKTINYPGAEAANHKARLDREFSKLYNTREAIPDVERLVAPPFMDPKNGEPWTRFTRGNLEMVIANIGNEYNFNAMAKGFKIDPQALMQWIESVTKPEDIDRAQKRGDMFKEVKKLHDVVERNVNGIAAADIEVRPFTMHGKTYEGWYHPIIDDPIRSPVKYLISDAEKEPSSFWPSVNTGFTKSRTGANHVIDLNPDMVPVKLNQMLHAVAFKEFVSNTAKIFKDREFRNLIDNHYGNEYNREMQMWLKDVAGNASFDEKQIGDLTALSNYFRQNVISTYIAFNPYTIQKHGLTAFWFSARELGSVSKFAKITAEVGADFFKHAAMDLFTKDPYLKDTLWRFIWDNSEEIQRRDRNWEESIKGQHDVMVGRSTWRNKIMQWGAKGVALSDMASAAPLWLGKYREVFQELGDHGQAVAEANQAVRRAHGSTAITNQPRMVRQAGPLGSWMTTLYGFFGTAMQRRIEIAENFNDMYKLGKQGELKQAAKMIPGTAASIMAYVIAPIAVEEYVTGQFAEDKRGLGEKAVLGLLGGIGSTFLYLREITYGLTHGREPGTGLLQGPIEDVRKLLLDIESKDRFNKHRAGRFVQDAITVLGDVTGKAPKALGSAARYGIDTLTGEQKTKTPGEAFRGVTRGTVKPIQVK